MAQAKSFFDDVKKEIECPVCQEQFGANKQPKLLKCLHIPFANHAWTDGFDIAQEPLVAQLAAQ